MKKFDRENRVKHQTPRPYTWNLEEEAQKEIQIVVDQNLNEGNLDREIKILTVIIAAKRSLQEGLSSTKERYLHIGICQHDRGNK